MPAFAVVNLTKRKVPDLPFAKYQEKILGSKYDLSLVFCGPALTHKLNRERRNKDKVANILSFPLSKNSGEIFIKLPATDFPVDKLFIHGLLHLKGLTHGSKMDSEERKFLALFNIDGKSQHNRRIGHRDRVGTARRLRT